MPTVVPRDPAVSEVDESVQPPTAPLVAEILPSLRTKKSAFEPDESSAPAKIAILVDVELATSPVYALLVPA